MSLQGLEKPGAGSSTQSPVLDSFIDLYFPVIRLQKTILKVSNSLQGTDCSLASSHINAMLLLNKYGLINMSQLAHGAACSRQQMTVIVDYLEEKGFLLRKRAQNRRVTLLEMTEQGKNVISQLEASITQEVLNEMFQADDDMAQAIFLVNQLAARSSDIGNL